MNELSRRIGRLQKTALVAGCAGGIACLVFAFGETRQFFISYLVGFTFWMGLSLGCLCVAMMHHLTGGNWGFATRRFLEAGFMTLPLMAGLFLPLLLGLPELYPWARPDAVAASEPLHHRADYLNPTAFVLRALLFLAAWLALAFFLRKWSLRQDATTDPTPTIRLRTLSGVGIVAYPITGTFAFIDWVMSIEPRWFSTMFAVIVLIGQILVAFAFVTMLLAWFRDQPPFQAIVARVHFHDLGNLLLAFVVFWTYVSFSQFLIIWSGNLPREIDWYLHRTAGGWKWIVGLLALFHFFVPFSLLLFRVMKRSVGRLVTIAALIFIVHIVEVFWIVEPSFFPAGMHIHWLDLAALVGMGGLWLALFAWNLKRNPLLPQNDPRIEYTLTAPAHAR
ncbi:MAG TPA: hypothetical protein VFZ59_18325 [Verrucomicrobiae bacterium]|nr:hypothetical protein [Verrucomicrobiae bacterium]